MTRVYMKKEKDTSLRWTNVQMSKVKDGWDFRIRRERRRVSGWVGGWVSEEDKKQKESWKEKEKRVRKRKEEMKKNRRQGRTREQRTAKKKGWMDEWEGWAIQYASIEKYKKSRWGVCFLSVSLCLCFEGLHGQWTMDNGQWEGGHEWDGSVPPHVHAHAHAHACTWRVQ